MNSWPRTAASLWAVADVTDRAALFAAVRDLESRLGPTDLLIASAGVGMETSALNFDAAVFETVVRVNLIGVANSVAAMLPGMLERKRGHLVGLSSLASYRGLPLMAGYCASKSGLNALFDALRVELKPHGIATTTVCPGWIRTPMTANLRIPVPKMLDVTDAARSAFCRRSKSTTAVLRLSRGHAPHGAIVALVAVTAQRLACGAIPAATAQVSVCSNQGQLP